MGGSHRESGHDFPGQCPIRVRGDGRCSNAGTTDGELAIQIIPPTDRICKESTGERHREARGDEQPTTGLPSATRIVPKDYLLPRCDGTRDRFNPVRTAAGRQVSFVVLGLGPMDSRTELHSSRVAAVGDLGRCSILERHRGSCGVLASGSRTDCGE